MRLIHTTREALSGLGVEVAEYVALYGHRSNGREGDRLQAMQALRALCSRAVVQQVSNHEHGVGVPGASRKGRRG